MKQAISIRYTYYENHPEINHYYVYICEPCGKELRDERIYNYTEAMKELRQFEKLLNKIAKLEINPYEKSIYFKVLRGYVDV